MNSLSNFNFFSEYNEGFKNNGHTKCKKGETYFIENEDRIKSKLIIDELTTKFNSQNNKLSKLYYIAHIAQLSSILRKGIKPRNIVESRNYSSFDISNSSVQQYRNYNIVLSNGKEVHIKDCVPLYFTPLHPMLYVRQNIINDLVIIAISVDVFKDKVEFAFSDKNAADSTVKIFNKLSELDNIEWDIITGDYWTDRFYGPEFEAWKEKRMAEFFIYPDIATIFISDFICANNIAQKKIESVIDEVHSIYPNFFNLDFKRDIKISENIIMR